MAYKSNVPGGLRNDSIYPSKPASGTGTGSARDQVQGEIDGTIGYINKYLNYVADTASTDDYVVTLDPAPTSYTDGLMIQFKTKTANTGACTLNVNGLGAKAIKKNKDEDLQDGDIKAGQIVAVVYDGTNFQIVSPVKQKTPTASSLDPSGGVDGDIWLKF